MKYSDKLKDPRWQRKRLEVMQRDEFTCCVCHDDKSTLNVHHMIYNGEPWETDIKFLITLCESCHTHHSENIKDAENTLMQTLKKKGFLSDDIYELSQAFDVLDIEGSPCATVNVLLNTFNRVGVIKQLYKKYCKL